MNVEYREFSNVGAQLPTFHVGTHVPKPKKHVKLRKKEVGGKILNVAAVHGAFTTSENCDDVVGINDSLKRKVWDTDVVMEDSTDDTKRLCGVNGILDVNSACADLQVAGVGEDQPREQQ